MSYNEKSAIAMSVLYALATIYLALTFIPKILSGDEVASLIDGSLFHIAIGFVIATIIIHIVLGIVFRKDAADGQDERDISVMYKAGAYSGSFLGFTTFWGIYTFATTQQAWHMFAICLMGLMIATTLCFVLQIVFYRRGH